MPAFAGVRRAVVDVALSGGSVEVACPAGAATRSATLMDERRTSICASPIFCLPRRTCRCGGSVPVVLFEHNVEYMIWQRLGAVESRPWRRALIEIEWRKLRAREADACTDADLTIAVSEDDRRRLEALAPGMRAASIPTGVDTNYFTPDGYRERADAARVQRLDGLASERGRRHLFRRRDPAADPRGDSRRDVHDRRPQSEPARARARRAAGIDRHRHGRRRAAVDRRGSGLRRSAPRRRRHAAEDFRGAGDGQGRSCRQRSAPKGSAWSPAGISSPADDPG